MSELKIEKGIPLPPVRPGISSTLRSTEVGDSVFLPGYKTTGAVRGILANLTGKFAARKVDGGVRVWRVA